MQVVVACKMQVSVVVFIKFGKKGQEMASRNHRFQVFFRRWAASLFVLSSIAFVIVAGGIADFRGSSNSTGDSQVVPLRVATTMLKPIDRYTVERTYLGRVESARESRIGFELGGKLLRVLVDEGDEVQEGQWLAELDTELLKNEESSLAAQVAAAQSRLDELVAGPRSEVIAAARADVLRWQAELKLATANSTRQSSLVNSVATSVREYDEAMSREASIRAQLLASQARLEELKNGTRSEQVATQRATLRRLESELKGVSIRIRKSRLVSPFHGRITGRFLDQGTVVNVGQPVFELHDNVQLRIRFGLPSRLVNAADFGKLDLDFKFRNANIDAKLIRVRPKKDVATQTMDVLFELDGNKTPAAVGEIVELRSSQVVAANGYWIPQAALVESYRGLWGCYVVVMDSDRERVRLTELEVLHRCEDRAFVRGAVRAEDRIVATGVHKLVANQIVQSADRRGLRTVSRSPISSPSR